MRFHRFGRSHHLRIETAQDLAAVLELAPAHWIAISAPIDGIHLDPDFMARLDTDADGRIRPEELRKAIEWTLAHLVDRSGLEAGADALRVAAIDPNSPDGPRLLKAIERVGATDGVLHLSTTRTVVDALEALPASPAGVIRPGVEDSAQTRALLEAVIALTGGVPHPSGSAGVDAASLKAGLDGIALEAAWRSERVQPFGDRTAALHTTWQQARRRVDRFFARCALVAVDRGLVDRFNLPPADTVGASKATEAELRALLESAPLATPNAEGVLRLDGGLNPAFRAEIAALRAGPLTEVLGEPPATLDEPAWRRCCAQFTAYDAWISRRPTAALASLSDAALEALTADAPRTGALRLIEDARRNAVALEDLQALERLLLFQAYLMRFCNNYVSFPDLYLRGRRALFDTGDLVMDGRRFNLAVRVPNRKIHVAATAQCNIYVMYLEITGKSIKPYEVAVAVTSGGRGNLMVGKRGIFTDVEGRELDARVVQVAKNPISLQEAVFAPFKRLAGIVTGKIESMTSSAEKKLEKVGQSAVGSVESAVKKGADTRAGAAAQQAPKTTATAGSTGGMLAGGGIALAAVGSSLAFISRTIAEMSWLAILSGLGGAIMAVVLPALVLAFIKLRRRDLSPMLEGSGWAINARMKLTRAQARYFTERPDYPRDATGVQTARWGRRLAVLFVMLAAAVAGILALL